MNNAFEYNFDLFDRFPSMYFLLGADGRILKTNAAANEILKKAGGIDQYAEIFDLVELCDRTKALNIFKKCLNKKTYGQCQTRFFINKELININLTFTVPIAGKDKSDTKIIAVARDITEEKQKEAELLRFYNIAEGTVNPVQITDLTGKMIYVNPAFVKISGYTKEELLGKNPRIFGSGKTSRKFWDRVWEVISGGKVWSGEIEDTKKNGEPFYSQLLISPILDKEEKIIGYFGIHRDLSEKRILEKQLIHTQKMESIGTLAAGIAHEVGNPLASISALVQVVQRDTNDAFIKEKLGLVKNQVTRISKIIRDLVDFSRPSNYELHLTNINKSIVEAVEITKVGTKAKNIQFNMKLSDDVPSLPLIPDQIHQVFLNILINAVDAITEAKTNGKPNSVEVKSFVEDGNVMVTFKDTGPGIEENNLNKVFEPFFTTKGQGKGTGLGLWVSYGIVKSFQGDINIESEPGKKTTFTITLPIET
ncbi:PAS domain S-box protein [bacterium BMS3Abin03]|nr:PAS domain S-box protein [bacterium BMS3Abin03]MCG6958785.1 PAS domain S-box protein [bacterium BMS3Abin03]